MNKSRQDDTITIAKGSKPKKIIAKKGKILKVTRSANYIEVTTNDIELIEKLKNEDGFKEV